jgi:hypothetical protein
VLVTLAEDNWETILPMIREPDEWSLRALHVRCAPMAEQGFAVVQVRRGLRREAEGRERAAGFGWVMTRCRIGQVLGAHVPTDQPT